MYDLKFGTRNKRGYWAPRDPLQTAPVLVFPPQPAKFLRWLPGYFLPWNVLFMAIAAIYWHLVDVIWIFLWPLFYLIPGSHP